jgi:hypothetical protein
MDEKYIVPILLGIITIVLLRLLMLVIKQFSADYSNYLNNLGTITTAQMRNEVSKNQRYCLIKSLKTMKKYLGWSIFLIVLTVISLGIFLVVDSRDYFQDYFEVQKNKLHLRSVAAVDSLENIINHKTFLVDSLLMVDKEKMLEIQSLKTTVKSSEKVVRNLENVIKHQNNMVVKMQKDIENLQKNNTP